MNQLLRLLLLAPATFPSIFSLMMVAPAHANSITSWVNISQNYTCMRAAVRESKQLICKRISESPDAGKVVDLTKSKAEVKDDNLLADGTPALSFEFTDEESNISVALFGCDCPVCIRSLRQLRSMMS